MTQDQSSNNTYREWLAKSIQEGFIKHYSEDDSLHRTLLGHGGYGVVYKGRIKHSGKLVAMKTLLLNRYECEDGLYKQFVKEVGITCRRNCCSVSNNNGRIHLINNIMPKNS